MSWHKNFRTSKKRGGNKRLSYFRSLISNRAFYFFLIIFIIGNISLYHITYTDQRSLALNDKVFENTTDLTTAYPENLLSDKFNSEPHASTPKYSYYALLFLGLMLGTELFVIASIIFLRKHSPKRYLLFYLLGMQLLVITPALVVGFTPDRVIADLNTQAKSDIAKQINLLSSSDGQKQLSVKSTPEEIRDSIIQSSTPPKVIDEQPDSQALIQSLQIQDKDTLYRVVILPRYVLSQESLGLNFDSYLFPNNTLVIKKPSKDLLANILPSLTWKIIEIELGEVVKDKKTPKFSILSDDAYNIVQTQKSEKIKLEFLSYFSEVKSSLADANYYIPLLQTQKKSLEEERVSYKTRTDRLLSECRGSYSVEDCKPVEDVINKNIASIENDLRLTNEALQIWIDVKPKLAYNLQQAQANYEKFLKFPITPELQAGVFNPPDAIYLKYYSEGEIIPSPSDYLSASLHEHFHYQAYSPAVFLPSFLDEGLTDYLASKLVKKYSFRQDLSVHYPEEIAIIQELLKTIPENKLLTAYFNQSGVEMERLIDSYYSKGTYKELKIKGEILTYTDPSDIQAKEQITKEIIELLSTNKPQ